MNEKLNYIDNLLVGNVKAVEYLEDIENYIDNLEKALNEIRKTIDNMKCEFELNSYVTEFVEKLDSELQIIDKVLGESNISKD